jgi:hypothetical protein
MLVLDQFRTVALVPFNATVLVPCVEPKPVPVIVTDTPTGPEVGEIDVTVGAWARARPQRVRRQADRTRIGFQLCERVIEVLPDFMPS